MSDDDKEYGYRIDPSGLNNCDRESGPGPEAWWDDSVADALKDLRDSVDLTRPVTLDILACFGPDKDAAQKQQMDAFLEMVRRKRQEAGLKPVQPQPATPWPDVYSSRVAEARRRLIENETGAYWLDLMMAAPLPKKGNDE